MNHTGSLPLAALRQLLTRPVAAVEQRCDLCGEPLADAHRHLVDTRARRLVCVCGTCLAAREQSADAVDGSRLRPVPPTDQYRPSFTIDREQWEALDIPVDLVFLFLNSASGRPVACYPGPAGTTESVLTLDAWSSLVGANLWIESLVPDLEALLVRRVDGAYSAVVVPIDRCYELAGRIRSAWSGMRGGDEVPLVIERFFAGLDHTCGVRS